MPASIFVPRRRRTHNRPKRQDTNRLMFHTPERLVESSGPSLPATAASATKPTVPARSNVCRPLNAELNNCVQGSGSGGDAAHVVVAHMPGCVQPVAMVRMDAQLPRYTQQIVNEYFMWSSMPVHELSLRMLAALVAQDMNSAPHQVYTLPSGMYVPIFFLRQLVQFHAERAIQTGSLIININ